MKKNKEVILYIVFGVCTTVVNVTSYWISAHILQIETLASTIIAWILAVCFAFFTNRKNVFHSEKNRAIDVFGEMLTFFLCRLITGIIDLLCMFVFVELCGISDVLIKFLANILVIILNYIASKYIIFKNKKSNK